MGGIVLPLGKTGVLVGLVLGFALVTQVGAHGRPQQVAAQHRFLAERREANIRRGLLPVQARNVQALCSSPLTGLGFEVTARSLVTGERLVCLTTDVSHPRDVQWQLDAGRVLEIAPADAERMCGTTRGHPSECPILIFKMEKRW